MSIVEEGYAVDSPDEWRCQLHEALMSGNAAYLRDVVEGFLYELSFGRLTLELLPPGPEWQDEDAVAPDGEVD